MLFVPVRVRGILCSCPFVFAHCSHFLVRALSRSRLFVFVPVRVRGFLCSCPFAFAASCVRARSRSLLLVSVPVRVSAFLPFFVRDSSCSRPFAHFSHFLVNGRSRLPMFVLLRVHIFFKSLCPCPAAYVLLEVRGYQRGPCGLLGVHRRFTGGPREIKGFSRNSQISESFPGSKGLAEFCNSLNSKGLSGLQRTLDCKGSSELQWTLKSQNGFRCEDSKTKSYVIKHISVPQPNQLFVPF
jgi:hypothetical protein